MGSQPGPYNVATTVTDMTSIVPMLGHHLRKAQNPRKKGESDEQRLSHVPALREWSVCPFDVRSYLPKLCTGMHLLPIKKKNKDLSGTRKRVWQKKRTNVFHMHNSLRVEAGEL